MWLACPGAIKENHSEYCPGVLPSIQGKVGVEGYPGNVINIQDMSNKEFLQQLWKKQALYMFQPSCIYLCQVLFLRHHYDPPRRAPSPISAYQDWHTQQWQNIQCSAGGRSSSKLGHQSQRRGEPREHNQYLLLLDVDVIFLDLSVLNVLVLDFTLKHRRYSHTIF